MKSDVSDILDSSEPDDHPSDSPYEPSPTPKGYKFHSYVISSDSASECSSSTNNMIDTEDDPDMQSQSTNLAPKQSITDNALPSASMLSADTPVPIASTFIINDLSDDSYKSHGTTTDNSTHSSEDEIVYFGTPSPSPHASTKIDLDIESDADQYRDSDEPSISPANEQDIAAIVNDDVHAELLDQEYIPSCSDLQYSSSQGITIFVFFFFVLYISIYII